MSNTNVIKTLEKAIATFGKEKQVIKAIEEMSELQKELCKALIGEASRENIIEEITDVYIMLTQIQIMYNISDDELVAEKKIERLEKRLTEISIDEIVSGLEDLIDDRKSFLTNDGFDDGTCFKYDIKVLENAIRLIKEQES